MKFKIKTKKEIYLYFIYILLITSFFANVFCFKKLFNLAKFDKKNTNFNQIGLSNLSTIKSKLSLQSKIQKYKQYSDEIIAMNKLHPAYSRLFTEFREENLEQTFLGHDKKTIEIKKMYAYFNRETKTVKYLKEQNKALKGDLISYGKFQRTRYMEGWDKLRIKTYSTFNPLLQCYTAGFIEGALTAKEIYYYYKNLHIFFRGNQKEVDQIKNFYKIIDKNIQERIKGDNFDKLKENEFRNLAYISCLHAQINGLHKGYNSEIDNNDHKLDLYDFYFINSEGNFGDIKNYMRVNNMKFNNEEEFYKDEILKEFYNTNDINKIWKDLIDYGHCSAIVKLVKDKNGKFDIFAGHNTWSDYSELIRILKVNTFAFEGNNSDSIFGMKPVSLNFSSYPGVLFSGDDFYLLDKKIGLIQTTLSVINKFYYKDILDLKEYIPEFMRLMIVNFTSNSGVEWVKNYKSFKNHMYITQFTIVDYNVLDRINNGEAIDSGLVMLTEEMPKSILSRDLTKEILEKSYFGSFNIAYFPQHQKITGMSHYQKINFYDKSHNPRYYILEQLAKTVIDLDSFKKLMMYNGYNKKNKDFPDDPSYNDPDNGISARGDLANQGYHGGIDFKVNFFILFIFFI
jgi:hypothetical protein